MNEEKQQNRSIDELKRNIVIQRLMQAPPTLKVSFGMTGGNFLERDELIKEVEEDSDIGKKIVEIQFAYMRALKNGLIAKG